MSAVLPRRGKTNVPARNSPRQNPLLQVKLNASSFLPPPQPYRQQHRYRQNKTEVEFTARLKHVGADEQKHNKPDELAQNVQLKKVAENKTHKEGIDAKGYKL